MQMKHLNETQRYTISRMRRDKKTQTEIARAIGVSQATVSKELKRNRCSDGRYSAKMAQMFADNVAYPDHPVRLGSPRGCARGFRHRPADACGGGQTVIRGQRPHHCPYYDIELETGIVISTLTFPEKG